MCCSVIGQVTASRGRKGITLRYNYAVIIISVPNHPVLKRNAQECADLDAVHDENGSSTAVLRLLTIT